jgi:hypothetical protein
MTYAQHEILLSAEDQELRQLCRWRVMYAAGRRPTVIATAPWSEDDPGRKRNIRLSRLVADRAGMEPGSVRFCDGNPLNCHRSNLYVTAPSRPRQAGQFRNPPQNPRGTHHHRLGDDRPAERYALCTGLRIGERSRRICQVRNIIAVARRLQPRSALWELQLIGEQGWSEPLPFHQLGMLLSAVRDDDAITSTERNGQVA